MKNMFKPVETVLPFSPTRWWYPVPGFNGYELSNDDYMRSMKHFRKYPSGILIESSQDKNGNVYYTLSDDNNIRRKVSLYDIKVSINEAATSNPAYRPNPTFSVNSRSRNKYVKNADGAYVKVYNGSKRGGGKKSYSVSPTDNNPKFAKFTVIDEKFDRPKDDNPTFVFEEDDD